MHVLIKVEGQHHVELTTAAPLPATQSSTLGKPGSVARNQCVTQIGAHPCDCGYPTIYGAFPNGTALALNATAAIDADGIVLSAASPGDGFKATATSYGRASWPLTTFFDKETQLTLTLALTPTFNYGIQPQP